MQTNNKKIDMTGSAKQMVYEQIRDWIIEGKLQEDEMISDAEIASQFNLSRTPVREAFQLLEIQKLIESYPGRGTFVTKVDHENLSKYYLPMITLQRLSVTMAIDSVTKKDIDELRQLNKVFSEFADSMSDPLATLKSDMSFHMKILSIADNEYLTDFCNVLWIHIQRLEYDFFKDSTTLALSVEEHEKVIDALACNDELSASILMEKHWNRTILELQHLEHIRNFNK